MLQFEKEEKEYKQNRKTNICKFYTVTKSLSEIGFSSLLHDVS